MSNISLVEAKLPPGFRFHPRDDELVCDYLLKKMILENSDSLLMIEVDLNKCEPWDIPDSACVGGKEWYFYSQRDRKYATGLRTNRATATGYWKATGKDRSIYRKGSLAGMRKTLVFYQGRAPKGRKTDWVMHEFRVEGPLGPPKMSSLKEDWVLCRVFFKTRELAVSAKPGIGSCYDLDRRTSSLPPLMDSYITFDQPNNNSDINSEYDEQVPCFSIFSQQQPNPSIFPHGNPQSDHVGLLNNPVPITTRYNATAADMGSCNYDDAFNSSSDKKVLKAVLNQLTKMEEQNPSIVKDTTSLGEGSSESYLSEVGMPHMWSHY